MPSTVHRTPRLMSLKRYFIQVVHNLVEKDELHKKKKNEAAAKHQLLGNMNLELMM